MATQFIFPYWNGGVSYEKFDVARGVDINDLAYYYATQASLGERPRAVYSYSTVSWTRKDDLITAYYTSTGSAVNFVPGSIVTALGGLVAGYTGMLVNAGASGASVGFIQFVNAGWNEAGNLAAGTITTSLSPAWTTGFFFVPSYNTQADSEPAIIESKMGDGYSQRMADGLNNNISKWELGFESRSDKEARAIMNFVQDMQGVYPFQIMLPVSRLANRPELKYVAKGVKLSPSSYDLNSVSVSVQQVFDL